jgi:futalosine hydrolase
VILVVCAVADELGGFAREGVSVVETGVGPVDAALATARALAGGSYRALVNAGIGGGFRGRAAVGDIVIVDVDAYADLGLENGEPLGLPGGRTLATSAASTPALVAAARARIPQASIGRGITSATVTTSDARASALDARFAPAVESMEGFAVLHAAAQAGVPAIEVRGISNLVGDRATRGWDFRSGSTAAVRGLAALLAAIG